MKKLMFKILTRLLVFFIIVIATKKILEFQVSKMGGNLNKVIESVKNGDYTEAIMEFTGESIIDETYDSNINEETNELIEEAKDKGIINTLKDQFTEIKESIGKIIQGDK